MDYFRSIIASLFVSFLVVLPGCNKAEDYPDVPEDEQMVLLVAVLEDNLTVKLPLAGTVDCYVDWDDGNTQKASQPYPTHTYGKAGLFAVSVSGKATALSSIGLDESERQRIIGINNWGKTGLTSMNCAFQGCGNLVMLPDDDIGSLNDVFDFGYAFHGCNGLTEIPALLFSHSEQVYSFQSTFQDCGNLKEIPAGLFDNCKKANYFESTFQNCESLEHIPAGLFDNSVQAFNFSKTFRDCEKLAEIPTGLFSQCPQVTSFAQTFQDCGNLKEIPAGLFDNCTEANRFEMCFQNCESLMEIPTALFDNCKKIDQLLLTFAGCTNLTGESPYTEINGTKIHLYERDGNNGFLAPTPPYRSFNGCNGLSDYEEMPDEWK